jgi:hypothetical protein
MTETSHPDDVVSGIPMRRSQIGSVWMFLRRQATHLAALISQTYLRIAILEQLQLQLCVELQLTSK